MQAWKAGVNGVKERAARIKGEPNKRLSPFLFSVLVVFLSSQFFKPDIAISMPPWYLNLKYWATGILAVQIALLFFFG
jgi:hypothetical protein